MRVLGNAFRGLIYVLKHERNMRIHLCFAFYVTLAGFIVGLEAAEWASVLACCGLVMGLECLNTALECVCDQVTTDYSAIIKKAKDASAGAVLVAAIFSAAAGCVIFFGKGRPEQGLSFLIENPLCSILLAASLVFWILMIFWRNKR